jgi:hypothetical protein
MYARPLKVKEGVIDTESYPGRRRGDRRGACVCDPGRCDHLRHARWQRPSRGWRVARAAALPRRHLGDLFGDVDLTDGLPHRRPLRPGRQPCRGHLRFVLQRRDGDGLLGQLARRPGLQPCTERPARRRGRDLGQARQGNHARAAAEGRLPERSQCRDAVHLGRLRSSVGDHQPGPGLPLRRYPVCRYRRAERAEPELAAHLDEPRAR